MTTNCWRITWWLLFVIWILDAILVMSHVRIGMITSYAADLTLPAWLYIATRSLNDPSRQTGFLRIIGRTPELAAGVIFCASSITEISQYYWPHGIFPGTFDPLDILAYATGIGACMLLDKRSNDPGIIESLLL